MNLKRVASAAAIAAGVAISPLMFGVGPVSAAPMDPPVPNPTGTGRAGRPCTATAPRRAGPHSGGGGPHERWRQHDGETTKIP